MGGAAVLALAAVLVLLLLVMALFCPPGAVLGAGLAGAAALGAAALACGAPSGGRIHGGRPGKPAGRHGAPALKRAARPYLTPAEAAVACAAQARQRAGDGSEAAPVFLADIGGTMPYRARGSAAAQCGTATHHGQRKLLLTEVEFLALARADLRAQGGGEKEGVLLYVGAGPGGHTALLLDLFPEFRAVLYDSTPFVPALAAHPRATIHSRYFTDADAKDVAAGALGPAARLYFISDIRSRSPGEHGGLQASEGDVRENLAQQRAWVEAIRPRAAMLKFRTPFDVDELEYLAGEVRLQPWAPVHSTETRLVLWAPPAGRAYPVARYTRANYEEALFYHNVVNRQLLRFANPALGRVRAAASPLSAGARGLDDCWDCARECGIWAAFSGADATPAALQALVARASDATRQYLDTAPHGDTRRRTHPSRACEPCPPPSKIE